MKGRAKDQRQVAMFSQELKDLIDLGHPLCRLSFSMPWEAIFQWRERVSVEAACASHGSGVFSEGVRKILEISIGLHGKKAEEKEVVVDTTVQEKNITFPTDVKMYRKIIDLRKDNGGRRYCSSSEVYTYGKEAYSGPAVSQYEKQRARKRFKRSTSIEPTIGYLKSNYRLMRNDLKGHLGDSINLMLAAAAFNFAKLLKELLSFLRSPFNPIFIPNPDVYIYSKANL